MSKLIFFQTFPYHIWLSFDPIGTRCHKIPLLILLFLPFLSIASTFWKYSYLSNHSLHHLDQLWLTLNSFLSWWANITMLTNIIIQYPHMFIKIMGQYLIFLTILDSILTQSWIILELCHSPLANNSILDIITLF